MRSREVSGAVLYLRVSTEEQARDAFGLESQRKACDEFCAERGWIIQDVFCDAGVSAWADVERPEFDRMMEYLRQNRKVVLVFYDLSRFSRRTLHGLTALRKLDKLKVAYVSASNPTLDSSTAAGRTAIREELSRAEDFSDQHSEKTSERMRAAFEDGRWCRPAPLGYQSIGTRSKGQSNLVPCDAEVPLVVQAFEEVALGYGMTRPFCASSTR